MSVPFPSTFQGLIPESARCASNSLSRTSRVRFMRKASRSASGFDDEDLRVGRRCAESHKSVLSRRLLRSQYEAVPEGPHPRGHWGLKTGDETNRQHDEAKALQGRGYMMCSLQTGARESDGRTEKEVISGQSGGVSTAHDGKRSLSAKFQPQFSFSDLPSRALIGHRH